MLEVVTDIMTRPEGMVDIMVCHGLVVGIRPRLEGVADSMARV